MSYVSIQDRIRAVPEEYLDEVSEYIDYVLFKVSKKKKEASEGTSRYFGAIRKPIDGMEIQRSMRNEWDCLPG